GLVAEGGNALGATVGDGWYMGLLGPGDVVRQHYYGKARRFSCHLRVEYRDGSVDELLSDGSWRVFLEGPVRSSDHFLGEVYDARKELDGWDRPGYDDSAWERASVDGSVGVNVEAQMHEPVRAIQTLTPIGLTEPEPGTYIFNLGQNLAGWCEITLDGPAGTAVKLRHGEMLDVDGSLLVENLRLATQTDTFVLDGSGPRTFHPHFTFHGFQYVEVTGYPGELEINDLVAKAISNDYEVVGEFECSNPMLNQLWCNVLWTQRDNTISVPTDCPQRNERMGWTGDAQVFAPTAMFNSGVAAFFSKFVRDLRDAQGEEGMYTDFAPHPFDSKYFFSFGPGWADCGVVLPWIVYVAYADTRLLKEHYESMKRYVDLIEEENPDRVWCVWGSNYGDWLNGDTLEAEGYPESGGEVPKDVFATAMYARSARLLSRVAEVLGMDDDAKRYGELARGVVEAFNERFVDSAGRVEGDTQAGYALALGLDLLPEEVRGAAFRHLLGALRRYDGRLSTGFLSTIHLLRVLSAAGRDDLAYGLVESRRFPSWGYTIEQGATTIWERWDGFVAGRGFQNKGMNSFNHYAFGSVAEWLYSVVLGINFDPAAPGMGRAVLKPRPGGSLTWARGQYRSIRGTVGVSWRRDAGRGTLTLEVDVPPNTTAKVILPVEDVGSVTKVEPARDVRPVDGELVTEVGSGHYEFVMRC
ncbi:MAG: family 78 glycoside hydrolase catalytic domain, partial [Promethearchaeota archaeon]